jgi:hypothetical protein
MMRKWHRPEHFEDALRAGWRRFGLGPLYVKQILKEPA